MRLERCGAGAVQVSGAQFQVPQHSEGSAPALPLPVTWGPACTGSAGASHHSPLQALTHAPGRVTNGRWCLLQVLSTAPDTNTGSGAQTQKQQGGWAQRSSHLPGTVVLPLGGWLLGAPGSLSPRFIAYSLRLGLASFPGHFTFLFPLP